jgi:hypothetical protein
MKLSWWPVVSRPDVKGTVQPVEQWFLRCIKTLLIEKTN